MQAWKQIAWIAVIVAFGVIYFVYEKPILRIFHLTSSLLRTCMIMLVLFVFVLTASKHPEGVLGFISMARNWLLHQSRPQETLPRRRGDVGDVPDLSEVESTYFGIVSGTHPEALPVRAGDMSTPSPTSNARRYKRSVSGLRKKRVAAQQGWKCGHCGIMLDETYEVDHKLALYHGGTNENDNLVALCRNCHGKKTATERLADEEY